MNPKFLIKNAGKIIQENSPTILAGLAVVGTAATGYFAAKGSFQASKDIEKQDDKRALAVEPASTNKEKALLVWKLYIPAVSAGALTIACIVASNRIHARRLAALAAGYAVLSGDFDEYREKAAELLGGKKAAELKKDIATGKIAGLPGSVEILPAGKTWFLDGTTMRPFPATMEEVKYAQNDINHRINNQQACSLNDFYDSLGLPNTTIGDILGWDGDQLIELAFTPVLSEDRGAVTMFAFAKDPKPNFWRG